MFAFGTRVIVNGSEPGRVIKTHVPRFYGNPVVTVRLDSGETGRYLPEQIDAYDPTYHGIIARVETFIR